MTIDPKALEAAARAYCTAIGLDYDRISPPLALKRDEATRAAILAYQAAFAEGWNIKSIRDGFPSAIEWIKTFRERTGCALKDAKEAYERGAVMPSLDRGWLTVDSAPEEKWIFTYREGELGSNICFRVGDNWFDGNGRSTTTHHSFAPPTHWHVPPALPLVGSGRNLADANQNHAQKEQG